LQITNKQSIIVAKFKHYYKYMRKRRDHIENPESLAQLEDAELQAVLLEGVSRTFALTIPQLPPELYKAVANAYLLCRIVDTIEDEVSLTAMQKKHFCGEFIKIVKTGDKAAAIAFTNELSPLLSESTIPAEHGLVRAIPRVIAITCSLKQEQIDALAGCVETMANGMPVFQALDLRAGLRSMKDMDDYCYYVAGCVGEMLAKLFCSYSKEIDENREELLKLSVSFGQGLQMTNILKDIWDDAKRGVCWLPQEIFNETGFELSELNSGFNDKNFQMGLTYLISIAHSHLYNALIYTQLLPKHETGIRNFCLWALGMALLTLNNIRNNLNFNDSNQVKISRTSVKATITVCRLFAGSNSMLAIIFKLLSRNLTTPDWKYLPELHTGH
jgi:farnesyl-diphosphate farnesyltransferase